MSAFSSSDDEHAQNSKSQRRRIVEVPLTAIHPPSLAYPKSLYHGHTPPTPRCHEKTVLREILVGGRGQ